MRHLVTGGTGFIGTHLVESLVADGHEVVVVTRSPENAAHLPDAVEVAEGDVTAPESMAGAMAGVDRVVHLAAWFQIGPGPWNEHRAERINVEGTRNVLELMDEHDVEKGVYASTIGIYGNAGGRLVDESYRSANAFPSVYQETKWRAHYEVAEPMMDDGLPLVVATLGAIFGPGDKHYGGTVGAAIASYLEGDLPVIPRTMTLPLDPVEDTARNLRLALERGEPGEEYIIAGESRRLVELFELASSITGVEAPRAVPDAVLRGLGHVVSAIERFKRPPDGFESELLHFLGNSRIRTDNTKARRELGIEHRDFEAALGEYLAWEMERLGLDGPAEGR